MSRTPRMFEVPKEFRSFPELFAEACRKLDSVAEQLGMPCEDFVARVGTPEGEVLKRWGVDKQKAPDKTLPEAKLFVKFLIPSNEKRLRDAHLRYALNVYGYDCHGELERDTGFKVAYYFLDPDMDDGQGTLREGLVLADPPDSHPRQGENMSRGHGAGGDFFLIVKHLPGQKNSWPSWSWIMRRDVR